MVQTRVTAHVEGTTVVVEYDGKRIKKLEPEDAIKCGGNIAAAGKIAKKCSNNEISPSYVSGNEYPDNNPVNHVSRVEKSDNDDEDDWKGSNKNSLINGSL